MKFDTHAKLYKACSDNDYSPVLQGIFFDKDKAIASNGHIMAIPKGL